VHDPSDAGVPCGSDEGLAVRDGPLERDVPVWEPHPVRVVQRRRTAQVLREPPWVLEVERGDVDPIAERVRAVGVAGERFHAPAGLQQASGDVLARVAECPRYDVNLGHRDLAGSSHRLESRDVVILVLDQGSHK
jgi:hypothetical protein